jgi:hypothetical protein
VECSLDQVLWADVSMDNTLHLSLLHRQKGGLALYHTAGSFDPVLVDAAETWIDTLMKAAYEGGPLYLIAPCTRTPKRWPARMPNQSPVENHDKSMRGSRKPSQSCVQLRIELYVLA